MRKPGGKNANRVPDRGQQVSVISQKNLKLTGFLFGYWWRCTFDCEVMGVREDTVHLLAGQNRHKDNDKDPFILPKVNESDMGGTIEDIKKYLRLYQGVVRAPLAYVIRKTFIKTYGDYPRYVIPDSKMIARMLHLTQKKIVS